MVIWGVDVASSIPIVNGTGIWAAPEFPLLISSSSKVPSTENVKEYEPGTKAGWVLISKLVAVFPFGILKPENIMCPLFHSVCSLLSPKKGYIPIGSLSTEKIAVPSRILPVLFIKFKSTIQLSPAYWILHSSVVSKISSLFAWIEKGIKQRSDRNINS